MQYQRLPQIECYMDHQSKNYGLNAICVTIGGIKVWYSYKTPVAFRAWGNPLVVRENTWGPTTGKHLNAIDDGDKANRVSSERFEELWAKQIQE